MEESIKLRSWNMDDLEALVKYANNEKIARNLTDAFPHPYLEKDGLRFIEMAAGKSPISIFCIDIDGEAAGGIGLHPQLDIMRKNMELGYWLSEPFWGRGIVSRIIPEVVDYGFRTWEVQRIFARPFGSNVASMRVLEKSGFVLEARLKSTVFKRGQYMDECIYAIRREDWKPLQNPMI